MALIVITLLLCQCSKRHMFSAQAGFSVIDGLKSLQFNDLVQLYTI